jgi:hypothetical protein
VCAESNAYHNRELNIIYDRITYREVVNEQYAKDEKCKDDEESNNCPLVMLPDDVLE